MVGIRSFPIGEAYFQGLRPLVSGRVTGTDPHPHREVSDVPSEDLPRDPGRFGEKFSLTAGLCKTLKINRLLRFLSGLCLVMSK